MFPTQGRMRQGRRSCHVAVLRGRSFDNSNAVPFRLAISRANAFAVSKLVPTKSNSSRSGPTSSQASTRGIRARLGAEMKATEFLERFARQDVPAPWAQVAATRG